MRSAGAVRCMRRLSVKLMLPIFQSQFPIGCAEDRATLAIGNIGTGNTTTLATLKTSTQIHDEDFLGGYRWWIVEKLINHPS